VDGQLLVTAEVPPPFSKPVVEQEWAGTPHREDELVPRAVKPFEVRQGRNGLDANVVFLRGERSSRGAGHGLALEEDSERHADREPDDKQES
jgi:hypothetical protein